MKPGDKAIERCEMDAHQSDSTRTRVRLRVWGGFRRESLIWSSILLALLLSGCAARKLAIRPGHDRPAPKHEDWACYAGNPEDPKSWWGDPTPVGIFVWKYFRLQRPFGVRCYDLNKREQDVKPKQEKRP